MTPFVGTVVTTTPTSATHFALSVYRDAVARVFGMVEGTATGGTTTTVVDTALTRYANDYWNGAQVYIKATVDGAAPQLQARYATDFVSSTGTLTVAPAYTVTAGAGDTYQILPRITIENLNAALDLACAGAEVATSLTPASSTVSYYVADATGLHRRQQITGVWRRLHNDQLTPPEQITGWHFEDAEGQLWLHLPYAVNADDHLWLTYLMGEQSFSSASESNLPVTLVRARAVVYLLEGLLGSNMGTEADDWGVKLRYWNETLLREERLYQRPVQKVQSFPWGLHTDTGLVTPGSTAATLRALRG